MYLRLEDPWGDEIRFDEDFCGHFPSIDGRSIFHTASSMPEGKYKFIAAVIHPKDTCGQVLWEIMEKLLVDGYFDERDLEGFYELLTCEPSLIYYIKQSIGALDSNTLLSAHIDYMHSKFLRDVDYYGEVTKGQIALVELSRELGVNDNWVLFDANGVTEAFQINE